MKTVDKHKEENLIQYIEGNTWHSEKNNQKVGWGVLGDTFKSIVRKVSLVFKYSLIAVKMNIMEIFEQNINSRKKKEPRKKPWKVQEIASLNEARTD